MVEMLSPILPAARPASHGNYINGVGVTLSETQPGSIVQVAAWPGQEAAVSIEIADLMRLELPAGPGGGVATGTSAVFGIAPGKFLAVSEAEGLGDSLRQVIGTSLGAVTDLSHGRTAIRIAGPKAEWVLAKFFAIDFAVDAFPVGKGVAAMHHDIFASIQRTGPDQFDLYVFRSFARSFWHSLCQASEEVGYEIR